MLHEYTVPMHSITPMPAIKIPQRLPEDAGLEAMRVPSL
jgi:hypothetical protein